MKLDYNFVLIRQKIKIKIIEIPLGVLWFLTGKIVLLRAITNTSYQQTQCMNLTQ